MARDTLTLIKWIFVSIWLNFGELEKNVNAFFGADNEVSLSTVNDCVILSHLEKFLQM